MINQLKKRVCPLLTGLSLGLIAGCGGGAGDAAQPAPETPVPPLPTPVKAPGLSATLLAGNQARLVITPGTDSLITGYCLRTDGVTPAADDACFGNSQTTQEVSTSGSATQGTSVRLWAKTSAGVVTQHKALTLPGKTCSPDAYAASAASSLPTACLITDKGELVFALEGDKAPQTVKNFLRYLNEGFYSGTHVHRVSATFVAQGGGYVFDGTQYNKKTAAYDAIPLESTAATKLSNTQYSVAMARSNALNSATSEFFINFVNNTDLDTTNGGYAVFGRVVFGQTTTLSAMLQIPVINSTLIKNENSLPVTPLALQWAYQIK